MPHTTTTIIAMYQVAGRTAIVSEREGLLYNQTICGYKILQKQKQQLLITAQMGSAGVSVEHSTSKYRTCEHLLAQLDEGAEELLLGNRLEEFRQLLQLRLVEQSQVVLRLHSQDIQSATSVLRIQ